MAQALTPPEPHTLARAGDPSTSRAAAEQAPALAVEHYRRIVDAMPAGQALGAEQIAERCGLEAYAVRKRLPELQRNGAVELAGGYRRTRSGRLERLWSSALC